MSKLTQQIYINSFPPEIAALMALPTGQERYQQAGVLVQRGFNGLDGAPAIDEAIMVDQEMTAEDVMTVRKNNGFTWVPSWGQQSLPSMPGDAFPGLTPYDPANPPPGSILVTDDPDKFPHYGPMPPAPPAPKNQIGEKFTLSDGRVVVLPTIYVGDVYEGEELTQNGMVYVAHVDYTKKPGVYFTPK